MTKERRFPFYAQCQAVMRKFTLARKSYFICSFSFQKETNQRKFFFHSCVPVVASGKAERSGAENEPRVLSFSWRKKRTKRTST